MEASKSNGDTFRAIVERSRDGICLIQLGLLKYVNQSLARMIGSSPEEMIDKSFVTYIHPDDLERVLERHARFETGYVDEQRYEISLIDRHGSRVEIELTESAVTENGIRSILIFVRNIHEQKNFEKDLKGRTFELGERVRFLNCFFMITKIIENGDLSLDELLTRIVQVIPSAFPCPEVTCARLIMEDKQFYSRNFRGELEWKQASDIVLHAQCIGKLEVCRSEQESDRGSNPFSNEERRLLDAVAARIGRTIERMRAMESMRKSEAKYRILVENSADGVAILQEGRLVLVNEALCSILGYKREELLEKDCLSLFHEEHKDYFSRLMNASLNNLKVLNLQLKCIRKDTCEIWTEASLNLIEWEGKSAILATVRDITEGKLLEIAREKERRKLHLENRNLRAIFDSRSGHCYMIGKSPAMKKIYDLALKAAFSDSIVLIQGESGTGKELVARTIHEMSNRRDKPFVAVNCGAIPESLFESEFFGHHKGAFTGAIATKHGFFDLALGGTLFLDEIAELSHQMQVKLLRVIEGNGYMPLGGNRIKKTDVRIISATSRNLGHQVRNGGMREDFFYRIHVIPIHLPPLRDRKEDIPLLVDYFLDSHPLQSGPSTVSKKIMEALLAHTWPGNVRELQNTLERYLTLGRLDYALPAKDETEPPQDEESGLDDMNLTCAVEHFQKAIIARVLAQTQWNRSKAAAILGIDRKTLFRKVKSYRLG